MRQTKSTLPVLSSFAIFFVAQTSITRFFLIVEKLNISAIYELIILIFSVNLYIILIDQFCKKSNPTTRRTSRIEFVEFQQWTSKLIWTLNWNKQNISIGNLKTSWSSCFIFYTQLAGPISGTHLIHMGPSRSTPTQLAGHFYSTHLIHMWPSRSAPSQLAGHIYSTHLIHMGPSRSAPTQLAGQIYSTHLIHMGPSRSAPTQLAGHIYSTH